MDKMCPLMFSGTISRCGHCGGNIFQCKKEECALWIQTYTTEGLPLNCCAIEAIAMKNSDGKYIV